MLKNLIKQPLLHFLLIGLVLFLLYNYTGSQNPEDLDSKTVVVDEGELLTFMQYRSKAFDRKKFENKLSAMPQEELDRLIDDYIREEVLYREAVGLGLDTNDYVIRRRLIQKLEFINKGFVDSTSGLSDEDINNFFEENKDDYFIDPDVTFTHVFFDKERHGSKKAQQLARDKLLKLNRGKVPFTESTKHGDRFPYHTNYVERTPDYVESHFGRDMAEKVFKSKPSDTAWQGPYESTYGYHLVMLTSNNRGKYPVIEEVRERVKQDAHYDYNRKKNEEIIEEIIDSYDVRIVYDQNARDGEVYEKSGGARSLNNTPAD